MLDHCFLIVFVFFFVFFLLLLVILVFFRWGLFLVGVIVGCEEFLKMPEVVALQMVLPFIFLVGLEHLLLERVAAAWLRLPICLLLVLLVVRLLLVFISGEQQFVGSE